MSGNVRLDPTNQNEISLGSRRKGMNDADRKIAAR